MRGAGWIALCALLLPVLAGCEDNGPEVRVDSVNPASVGRLGATPLQISGSGFQLPLVTDLGSDMVTFGTVEVVIGAVVITDVQIQSESMLTATAPAGSLEAGQQDVRVSFSDGRSGVLTGAVEVVPPRLRFAASPAAIAGQCSVDRAEILIDDGAGNLVAAATDVVVTLSSDDPQLTFHPNPSCNQPLTEAVIPAGTSSVRVNFLTPNGGMPLLRAEAPGFSSAEITAGVAFP